MKTNRSLIEPLEARIAPAAVAAINLGSLDGKTGFKLSGLADGDRTGVSVSDAGDVNGDGFADVIVGAFRADEGILNADRGASYVIFGKAGGFDATVALSALDGTDGFKLSGVADSDYSGRSVSAAGDVNGDGFADLIIGASRADEGGTNRGASYVVFGKADFSATAGTLHLSDLIGTNGFKLSGAADDDNSGRSVGAAGDVNGDGFADLIIGADGAEEGGTDRGASYVVFGKAGGFAATVALSALDGSNGFKLSGVADNDNAGRSVSAAGDVNGDGFADLIIGAPFADEGGTDRGASYVVFGKAGGFGATVALSALDGTNGFTLSGLANSDFSGFSVDTAGDVNGDGFGDLIIGAYLANEGGDDHGASYVIFGKAGGFGASVTLSGLNGSNGFKLRGAADNDFAGFSVSAAGDVNGDGFGDLIIGAIRAAGSAFISGASYVIFGKADFSATTGSLNLGALDGTNGFKLSGVAAGDKSGSSVSAAGDVNGDGFADLIIGAYLANEGGLLRGAGYVVFGFGAAEVNVASGGKSATFTDWDGDLVTIKSSAGPLDPAQFHLSSPNPATGGAHLIYADFTAGAGFANANLSFTATRGANGGDGLVDVGTIDARGVVLGKVSVDGDLQQLDAAGVAGLTVYSLGQAAAADVHGAPLTSAIGLKLGALTVKTDASRVTLAAQTFGAITVKGALDDVRLFATGVVNPGNDAAASAIKSLTIGGSVSHSQILAGYDAAGKPFNADVQIGAVKVSGNWIASNLVAGMNAGLGGIFADADATELPIFGGNTINSKIASVAITGAVMGTAENRRDGFGFQAQEIGSLKLGKATVPLTKDADNDPTPQFLGVTDDVRVRETGTPELPPAPIASPAGPASIALGGLGGTKGFDLRGIDDGDYAGFSVSAAGDVNGDGFADVILGAEWADEGGAMGADRGAAYVVFGKEGGYSVGIGLDVLAGDLGFKLSGDFDVDSAGYSVSGAGDVNGDGFDDVIVGAPGANAGGGTNANRGEAYVIFGKAGGFASSIALGSLNGTDGFKLSGIANGDQAGFAVSAAGDVNHDGFGDVIVGANMADEVSAAGDSGAAYLVFGKANGFGNLVLSALDGSNGFKLSGAADGDDAGFSVSEAGDVNGDGFGDVIVGANEADEGGTDRGAAYVIFGRAGGFGSAVALGSLMGADGFKLSGEANGDKAGYAASAAGDVNGDGFADLIVGAATAPGGGTDRGAAYVIFGKAGAFGASIALGSLAGADGFKLSNAVDGDKAGFSASGAGDVNGDGLDDLIVGAPFASAINNNGAAYVVFGKTGGFGNMALSALDGANGFKLTGAFDGDYAGWSVSGAGDVNGDGFGDLLVGVYGFDGLGTNRGVAYVVYGFGTATVDVDATGKKITFTDWDGDLVTINSSASPLLGSRFHLSSPNPLTGGSHLVNVDFNGVAAGASLSITAQRGPRGGDGLVNVGTIDATNTTFGKVTIDGDLQQIEADVVAGLNVWSLGQFAAEEVHGEPLESNFITSLGALTVKTDARRVTLVAPTFGAIKALSLDDVRIFADGILNPDKATVIKSLTVGGSVSHSRILAGYRSAGNAFNADVQIGKVKVLGNWTASDLVAGVRTGDDGLFATGDTNELLIAGGNAIVAKIASITITGAVRGTADDAHDGFGFAAEEFGALSIGNAKVPLQKGARNDLTPLILSLTGDTRVREAAM